MHVRAHDLGRNLFVNATGMLGICVATMVACLLVQGRGSTIRPAEPPPIG